MQQMAQSAVFLSGMGALGVEIGTPLLLQSLPNGYRKYIIPSISHNLRCQ